MAQIDGLEDRLLTVAEAARYLGYTEGSLRNKANAGEIPCVKLGTAARAALRFRKSDLDRWIAKQDADAKALKAGGTGEVA